MILKKFLSYSAMFFPRRVKKNKKLSVRICHGTGYVGIDVETSTNHIDDITFFASGMVGPGIRRQCGGEARPAVGCRYLRIFYDFLL